LKYGIALSCVLSLCGEKFAHAMYTKIFNKNSNAFDVQNIPIKMDGKFSSSKLVIRYTKFFTNKLLHLHVILFYDFL